MTSIDTFVAQENSLNARGTYGVGIDYNAVGSAAAGTNLGTITPSAGQNAVIGFDSAIFTAGYDVVLLDGPRASYAIQVNGSGATVIKDIGVGDATYGQTVTVSGESYILFNGAHISLGDAATPAALTVPPGSTGGVLNYPNDIYFVDNQANAQLAQFFSAMLPWEPQPGLAGYEYWVNQLQTGMALSAIAQSFINTSYFQQTFGDPGTTHAQHLAYVQLLYQHILGMTLTATNAGVQYWTNDMDSGILDGAGTLISFTNATANSSTVNAVAGATAGAGSGWLINYSLTGGYADPTLLLPAQTVFDQAVSSHYLNTALIDPTALQYAQSSNFQPFGGGGYDIVGGTVTIKNGVSTYSNYQLDASESNATVVLTGQFATASVYGASVTIYNSTQANGSLFVYGAGDTVILSHAVATTVSMYGQTGDYPANILTPGAAMIYDFIPGTDILKTPTLDAAHGTLGKPVVFLDATHGALFNGASLNFANDGFVLKLANVGGGTATEVAAAVNAVYTLAEQAGSLPSVPLSATNYSKVVMGENLTVVGQTAAGDAVVYQFANTQALSFPTGNPDLNGNHHVDANELTYIATLVGVQVGSLTTHDLA